MTGIAGWIGQPNREQVMMMMQRLAHRGNGDIGIYDGIQAALAVRQFTPPADEAATATEATEAAPNTATAENALDETAHFTGGTSGTKKKAETAEKRKTPIRSARRDGAGVIDGQPFSDGPKNIRVVFDGELTNARELRAELIAAGAKFESAGDPEVVLEAYRRFGTGAFGRLVGPFALAIWDQRTTTCYLARDPFGLRPLFMQRVGESLRFASEIKALMALPDFPRELDPFAVEDYFTWGYIPAPRTIWRAVRALAAGHFASFRDGQLTTHRYFALHWPLATEVRSREDWLLDLFAYLEQATGRALYASGPTPTPKHSVPWMALDCRVESALMAVLTGRLSSTAKPAAKAVAVAFEPDPLGTKESTCAPEMAELAGLAVTETIVPLADTDAGGAKSGGDRVAQGLAELAAHLDQPVADPLLILRLLNWRDLRAAGATVVIDTLGADELFAGHRRVQALVRSERMGWAPPLLRDFSAKLARWLPDLDQIRLARRMLGGPSGLGRRTSPRAEGRFQAQLALRETAMPVASAWRELRRFLRGFVLPTRERYLNWLTVFSSPTVTPLFFTGFSDLCEAHDPFREFRIAFDRLMPGQPTRRTAPTSGSNTSASSWSEVAGARRDWPSDWDLPGTISGAIVARLPDGASLAAPLREGRPYADRALALDMASWLPGYVTANAEAVAALAGVTLRAPYLDRDLVEWATHLPASMKLGVPGGKRILHLALRETGAVSCTGPDAQAQRRQFAQWLLSPGHLETMIRETITDAQTAQRGVLDPKTISRMLTAHHTGAENLALEIFAIYMFEAWCRAH